MTTTPKPATNATLVILITALTQLTRGQLATSVSPTTPIPRLTETPPLIPEGYTEISDTAALLTTAEDDCPQASACLDEYLKRKLRCHRCMSTSVDSLVLWKTDDSECKNFTREEPSLLQLIKCENEALKKRNTFSHQIIQLQCAMDANLEKCRRPKMDYHDIVQMQDRCLKKANKRYYDKASAKEDKKRRHVRKAGSLETPSENDIQYQEKPTFLFGSRTRNTEPHLGRPDLFQTGDIRIGNICNIALEKKYGDQCSDLQLQCISKIARYDSCQEIYNLQKSGVKDLQRKLIKADAELELCSVLYA